jgi:hypothetical protein
LLVDLVMPGEQPDGLGFALTAKARVPDVPAIFLTGYYGFVTGVGTLPGSVLCKPLDLDGLRSEINSGLGG